jgi:hypothetical protein
MGNEDTTRIAKLPRWAQAKIRQLDNRILTLEKKLGARTDLGAAIIADYYSEDPNGYSRHTVITYKLAHNRELTIHHAGERLEIYGSHTIAIEPQACNHFHVRVSE